MKHITSFNGGVVVSAYQVTLYRYSRKLWQVCFGSFDVVIVAIIICICKYLIDVCGYRYFGSFIINFRQ